MSLKYLMLTGATLLYVNYGMASSMGDAEAEDTYESIPSRPPEISSARQLSPMFDEAALKQIAPYVPVGLEAYPDLYHQGITRSLQQAIKNQYHKLNSLKEDEQAIRGGKSIKQKKEEELKNIKEEINQKEEEIRQHKDVLASYKSLRENEEALKIHLDDTIKQYEERLEKAESSSESATTINMLIKKAEGQRKVLSTPLSKREIELDLLKDTLNKRVKEVELAEQHPLNLEDIQVRLKKENSFLNDLIYLRAKTVYLTPAFLPEKGGSLFASQDAKRALKKLVLPEMISSIDALEDQKVWRNFAQILELPDPKLPSSSSGSLLEAYNSHIKKLKNKLTKRLKEDAFYLQMIMGLLATYNEKALIDQRPRLQINTKAFDDRETKLLTSLKKRDHFIDLGPREASLRNLKYLLQAAGITIEEENLGPVIEKNGFIGRLIGSIERGQYYSWQSRSLLSGAHQKLSKGEDITDEVMTSLYSFLGRAINKAALEVILEDMAPAAPVIVPVEEVEEEENLVPLNFS